ncbi:hypothetical protein FRC03_004869 [Tulasnella sp. 419]|nr:hypothetical protein FRC02_004142 [Tulasnella sp. 418]KAG8941082.1 hypothetical protein FRC03_004869 [Tulasnella sp. 419]
MSSSESSAQKRTLRYDSEEIGEPSIRELVDDANQLIETGLIPDEATEMLRKKAFLGYVFVDVLTEMGDEYIDNRPLDKKAVTVLVGKSRTDGTSFQ